MTATFLLPLAMGACEAAGGNVMTEAFGCVALVAMAPIISIQICGLVYRLKTVGQQRKFVSANETFIDYGYVDERKTESRVKGAK